MEHHHPTTHSPSHTTLHSWPLYLRAHYCSMASSSMGSSILACSERRAWSTSRAAG
ncbi:unnamed protein product, partial [Vitis vinifera]|uniref:Uncharacterized protein n=1 Tax=Vitis vinifera TaxID=29760 RepID=D7TTL0_VITVI